MDLDWAIVINYEPVLVGSPSLGLIGGDSLSYELRKNFENGNLDYRERGVFARALRLTR
jgi:hypothetical protein